MICRTPGLSIISSDISRIKPSELIQMTRSPVVELGIEPGCSWLAGCRWGWPRRCYRPGPRTPWRKSILELQERLVLVVLAAAADASASVASKISWRCCWHWRSGSQRNGGRYLHYLAHSQSPVKMTPIIIGRILVYWYSKHAAKHSRIFNVWKVIIIEYLASKTINSSINA